MSVYLIMTCKYAYVYRSVKSSTTSCPSYLEKESEFWKMTKHLSMNSRAAYFHDTTLNSKGFGDFKKITLIFTLEGCFSDASIERSLEDNELTL